MLSRINIFKIITDHFATLRKVGSQSKWMSFPDILLFILLPIILASLLVLNDFQLEKYLTNLIAAISIFGGFLFNLLAIIYGQIDKIRQDALTENNAIKKQFVREIHVNISFNIVLSIFLVVTLLLFSAQLNIGCYTKYLRAVILWINGFLLNLFLLTLLMVLNRVYILLKKDSEI